LEHQDGGRDVISNTLFLPSPYMVVFKTSTAMHSHKMSEMNQLESRDSKQKCRGRIRAFFSDENATVITVTPLRSHG